jgi:anti-sigma regulatory factor (Ser/Thr protein kinase)
MISRIETTGNRVKVVGEFVLDQLRRISAAVYSLVEKLGYQDLVLDFSECTLARPAPMIGLCAEISALRFRGIDVELVLPKSNELSRLFMNCSWAHTLDPVRHRRSTYRGVRNLPVTRFATHGEQHELMNQFMQKILSSMETLEREDVKAVEWSINEMTDNVITHANSPVGGFVQLSNFPTKRRVELLVADAGDGIPKTLRPSFPNLTDSQLIEQATKEGVTRDKQLGRFEILSGHGSLRYASEELRLTNEKVPFPGTLIFASFDTSDKDVLSRALRIGNEQYTPVDFVSLRYDGGETDGLIFRMHEEAESTGSRMAGTPVRQRLRNLIRMHPGRRVRVDLSQVPILSSSFADEVFGKLFRDIGPLAFASTVELVDLSSIVRQLIDKAIVQRMRTQSQPNED